MHVTTIFSKLCLLYLILVWQGNVIRFPIHRTRIFRVLLEAMHFPTKHYITLCLFLNISFKRGNVISHQRAHYAPLQVKLAERAFLWHIVSKRFAAVHLIGCCIVSFPPSHLSLRKNDYLAAFTPENGYIGDFSPTESLLYSGISPIL